MNELKNAYYSRDINRKHTHYHDCHQIILITKGCVEVTVNEKSFTAGEKSLLIFSRYETHSLEVKSNEYERYVLWINPVSNRLYSRLSNRPEGFSNIFDISDSFERLENVFALLCEEYSKSEEHREEMLELLSGQLMITLDRILPRCEYNELVWSVQTLFETEFSKGWTIAGLASEYSVSPSTLSHEFKRVTGSSVMEYLLSCRIASAKNLLTKTTLNIGEIVELCGFSDASNFSRTFKALTGDTPSAFRKKFS